jgi:glycosyltransferase involved in cell wall biosynthesis
MTARVTIGIPFLNAAAWLPLTIRSVFAQSIDDWELFLVDDGSTDASVGIASSIRDERVHVIADGLHRGLSWRLNEITALASAMFVARMDADDLMHPQRLARQLAEFDRHGQLDVCASVAITIDECNRPLGLRGVAMPPASALSVFAHGLFVHPTVMFRRDWALRHPYSDRYARAADRHLWCSCFPHLTFSVVDEALLFYRDPAPIRLGPYLATNRFVRQLIRELGPQHLGWVQRTSLALRSHLADAAHRAASLSGTDRVLLRRRYSALSGMEVRRYDEVLAHIARTFVPGVDRAE